MHEASLMADLIGKLLAVASEQKARRIVKVRIKLGAFSHVKPEHLREHFRYAVTGTVAEGAQLDIEMGATTDDAHAQEVLLDSLEVEV